MTITDYLKKIRDNVWNTAQLGREFEKFVKKFLLTEPSFKSQFSDVWLWSECPFAKGNDVGIDLVAKNLLRRVCGDSGEVLSAGDSGG